MALEKVETIEKQDITRWLNKADYKGRETAFIIEEVLKFNQDTVLNLTERDNPEEEPKLLRIKVSSKNELVDKFGTDAKEWERKTITIKFSEYSNEENKEISNGITTDLIWKADFSY